MQENKIFKEFLENTYDKDKNYNSICSYIKGGIYMKKNLLNIAAVILTVLVIGISAQNIYAKIAWNIEYKEYQKRNVITRQIAIDENSKDGYIENLNMDYTYQDNIGIKIKSLIITNDYCQIDFDTKLNEDVNKISYGYVVYDENYTIYACSERWSKSKNNKSYLQKLYKELGIKNNKSKILSDSSWHGISKISMTSNIGFPNSKKLYIRIFDIGYDIFKENGSVEQIDLSNSEWQFEIDVPEKFYERTTIQLVLKNDVEGIVINKAELTQTGLVIKADIKQLRDFLMSGKDMKSEDYEKLENAVFYISDGNDNIYRATGLGTTNKANEISARFGIGKKDLDKKIFLNVSLNDIQEKVELVQK